MKQVTINIPDNKYPFFIELIKSLDFTRIEEKPKEKKLTAKQQEFVDDLKQSLDDVDQHLQGKKTLKSADQLLNEL